MAKMIVLPNGLRIVMELIPHVKSVAVGLWIKAGVVTESEENNGISHFIEHMLFKGTDTRSALDIAEAVDGVGGQINAYTSREYTCYYMKVLDENLAMAVDLLSDMMFNSLFDPNEIDKEKSVIAEEISMYEDSPEDLAHDMLIENMLRHQPLGYPILGSHETINALDQKALKSYLQQHYRPDNTVLAVAGHFEEEALIQMIETHFGQWEATPVSHVPSNTRSLSFSDDFRYKDIEQIHLSMGFQGAALGSDEMYDLLVINNIIGGSMSSRLFQTIREDKGLVYTIYSYMQNYTGNGIFSIYCSMNPSQVSLVRELIDSELSQLLANGFETEEFEKARRQLKGSYLLGMESTSGRMASMGKSELLLRKIQTPDEILLKINQLDKSSAEHVMRQFMHPDQKSVVLVGRTNVEMPASLPK